MHELLERLARGTHGGGLGNAEKTLTKTPLEYLYEVFATYVEDRRREPRDDVLTGLATATFPDGTMPEVGRRGAGGHERVLGRPGDRRSGCSAPR